MAPESAKCVATHLSFFWKVLTNHLTFNGASSAVLNKIEIL
jgi:hypothetical protein